MTLYSSRLLPGPDLVVGVVGLGPLPGPHHLQAEERGEQDQGGLPHPHPAGEGGSWGWEAQVSDLVL